MCAVLNGAGGVGFGDGAFEFVDFSKQSSGNSGGGELTHALQSFETRLGEIEIALLFGDLVVDGLELFAVGGRGLPFKDIEGGGGALDLVLRTGKKLRKVRGLSVVDVVGMI